MATIKQKLALDKTLENGGNVTQAMREVEYKETTIHNPKNLTESKGFKALCKEKGLTDSFLVEALVEDIEEKPQNRKQELELGFKVIGKLKEHSEGNRTLILMVSGENAQRFKLQTSHDTESSSS